MYVVVTPISAEMTESTLTSQHNVTMNATQSNSTFCSAYSLLFISARTIPCYFNVVFSLPVNGFIVWLIAFGVVGTVATEFFTLNLAVNEILVCLSCLFNVLAVNTNLLQIIHVLLLDVFLTIIRPLFQTLICLERYLAVCQPVFFLWCKPLRYRVALFSVIWMLSIICYLHIIFHTQSQMTHFSFVFFYLFIFLLMFFCFVSVLRALRQPSNGARQTESGVGNGMKKKAFNITLINMAILTSYIPFFATSKDWINYDQGQCFLSVSLLSVLSFLTGSIHPLLYLKRLKKLPCIQEK